MRKDIALIAVIVTSLALMVIPLSSTIIDILLAVNISLGVLLLMVAVYLKNPSDFSTFPSVILIGTAFRLALSIGTTRLILSEAEAGDIIETFGEFVVSGSIAIGLVIFLIITVVQFIVVTKGAERVAEVGARFALDALPGKQMAIDAEARAGNLTAEEAATKRRRLDRDSRFFGAMDGAMKFVKGDAIAGLIIIMINLIGGVAVGMSTHGFGFGEAVGVFSLLTVGDGLVAQIPALLMSLCAGIIVTRADGQESKDLGSDISAELVSDPRVPAIGAPIILAIGFIPGFPTLVFAFLAVGLFIISSAIRRSIRKAEEAVAAQKDVEEAAAAEAERAGTELPVGDRVRLKIGRGLAGDLDIDAVEAMLAGHLGALYAARGIRFPRPVVEWADLSDPLGLTVEIDEVPIASIAFPRGHIAIVGCSAIDLLADAESSNCVHWPLVDTVWMSDARRTEVNRHGLEETPAETVVANWGFRLYEQNLGGLFSHAVLNDLLADIRGAEPELMATIEEELNQGSLYKVFRYLIEDGVPLRPLSLVASSIRYWLSTLNEVTPVALAEGLRASMKRQLCHRIAGNDGVLGVALLGPDLEVQCRKRLAEAQRNGIGVDHESLILDTASSERLLVAVRGLSDRKATGGRQVALVAAADLRRRVRNYLAGNNIHIAVLAPHELAAEIPCFPVELVENKTPVARMVRSQNAPHVADATAA